MPQLCCGARMGMREECPIHSFLDVSAQFAYTKVLGQSRACLQGACLFVSPGPVAMRPAHMHSTSFGFPGHACGSGAVCRVHG